MSALALSQSYTAVAPNITASFLASGGTPAYTYSVRSGGAGGTINSSTGLYTAPAQLGTSPQTTFDTIQVVDSVGAVASAQILVGSAILLVCDILQNQLNLAPGHLYLWDQKTFQPTDDLLYIAVGVLSCKPFSNANVMNGSGGGLNSLQTVNMQATLSLDIMSRSSAARDQKEFVLMALASNYSEQQQEANNFFIGKLPAGSQFRNLSFIDGAAIPYRFQIDVNIQYVISKTQAVQYFDSFATPQVTTNP